MITEQMLQNNLSFLIEDESAFSYTAYRIMQNDKSGSLIQCVQTRLNGIIQIIYLTDEYVPLCTAMEQLQEEKIIGLIAGTFHHLQILSEYGFLNLSNLYVDLDKIYVDMKTLGIRFVYLPVNTGKENFQGSVVEKLKINFIKQIHRKKIVSDQYDKVEELLDILYDGTLDIKEAVKKLWSLSGEKKQLFSNSTDASNEKDAVSELCLVETRSGRMFRIDGAELIIGRNAPTKEGRIIDTKKTLGRQHCKIIKKNQSYYLVDLESKNGTFLNGKRVRSMQEMILNEGDRIRIAHIELTVKNMED